MGKSVLDLLYPENLYCIVCGDTIDRNHIHSLCDKCIENIHWLSDNPYATSMDDFFFDDLFPCCIYSFYTRSVILKFKSGDTYLCKPLGKIMAERLPNKNYDAIVFVPSSKERIKQRGYNQAKLLAKEISKITKIPLLDALEKQETSQMKKASRIDRLTKLQGSMNVKDNQLSAIKDKRLLLVDDIVTTASTVNEASRVLKSSGANRIDVLCFACGNNMYGIKQQV